MNKYCIIAFFGLSLTINNGFAAGDPGTGKQKSQTCTACHGVGGNSNNPVWPKLAGQHAGYIIKQLTDFQTDARVNPQMTPMAKNLSTDDMADLAAYFTSQEVKYGATDPAMLELGEKIYRAGNSEVGVPACLACHGPRGRGNPAAGYPWLAGQHTDYTLTQLNAFREDKRTNDANEVMRSIVDRMTDDEMKAVSEYIQGLH